VYTLWTFNRIFFGNLRVLSVTAYQDLNRKEFALFSVLIVALFFLGLVPHYVLDTFFVDCVNLLEHAKL
jgi:NADH:ubiquinone oxidoreductase subunit 4 (subunit M)